MGRSEQRQGVRQRTPAANSEGVRPGNAGVAEFARKFTARYGEAMRRLAGR